MVGFCHGGNLPAGHDGKVMVNVMVMVKVKGMVNVMVKVMVMVMVMTMTKITEALPPGLKHIHLS